MKIKTCRLDDFCKENIPKILLNKQNVITLENVASYFLKRDTFLKWQSIGNWQAFEMENREYTTREIIEIFEIHNFFKLSNKKALYLITIESYTTNTIFELKSTEEFIFFIENYSSITNEKIEFMQPMDYILFDKSFNHFVLIHHDGNKLVFHQS